MFGKKMFLAGTAVILTFSLSVLPAFAHGHGHRGGGHCGNWTSQPAAGSNYDTGAAGNADIHAGASLPADPEITAAPSPDAGNTADPNANAGTAAAPNANTGTAAVSGAYPVCPVEGCAETGRHLHDGSYYCGYHHSGGYCDGSCTVSGAYPVCPVEGCAETGRHLHDGSYYCGYHHSGGYCDGSCVSSSPTVSNSQTAGYTPAVSGYGFGRGHGCHRSYAKRQVYCY